MRPITQADAVGVDRGPTELPQDFDAFYRREMPRLVTYARALAGPAHAYDMAQESMLAAYQRWDEVAACDSPVAWVRRVCSNRSVSAYRRRVAEARSLVRLGWRREPVAQAEEPDAELWSEVRRLPARQAQTVALHYLYDLSVADIAATLGIAEGTVKAHLARGRAALAARLGETQEDPS